MGSGAVGDTPYPAGSSPATSTTHSKRGDLCPAVVEEIALPPPGTKGIRIEDISPRAAVLVKDYETLMLLGDEQDQGSPSITPYNDPALRSQRNMVDLAVRMAQADMLLATDECEGTTALFTVVKKWVVNPDGTKSRTSRLVFDERLENLRWRRPPWCALGAGTSLGFIDASVEVQQGGRVQAAV